MSRWQYKRLRDGKHDYLPAEKITVDFVPLTAILTTRLRIAK